MDFKSSCKSNTSNIEDSADLKTDNDTIRITEGEVSDKVMKQTKSDGENSKKQTKNRKLSRKRKIPDHQSSFEKEVKKVPRKRNSASAAAVPNNAECPTSHNTHEDAMEVLEDEVLNQLKTTNNTADSDRKSTENRAEDGKLSSKGKKPYHQPTLETDDKKTLRKGNPASVVNSPNPNIRTHENTNTSNISTYENINGNLSDGATKKVKTTNKPTRSSEKSNKKLSKDGKQLNTKQKSDILPMLQMEKTTKVMTKQNVATVGSGENAVEGSNTQANEDHIENQSSEVLYEKKTAEEPASLNKKNSKKAAKEDISKISQKRKKLNQVPDLQTEAKDDKDKMNKNVHFVKPGPLDNVPNLKTKEDTKRIEDLSNNFKKIKRSENSDKKTSNVANNHGKLPLKIKKPRYPPTSQMVMEAIKVLKKRNGASVDAILEYMQGKYRVNTKLIKRYVTRYMNSAVQKGILDKTGGAGDNGRFKTKKTEKIAEDGKKYYQKRAKNRKKL